MLDQVFFIKKIIFRFSESNGGGGGRVNMRLDIDKMNCDAIAKRARHSIPPLPDLRKDVVIGFSK